MVSFTNIAFSTVALFIASVHCAPAAPNLIGNGIQGIGLASQNQAINNGNTAETASKSQGTGNVAQQATSDNSSIDVIKNLQAFENPLVLV
jgi:hypothetical protein